MNAALLLTALFNGAWQGAALCALAYLVLRTQRRLNATTMFAVWSVLLGIALALPAANYVFAARPYTLHVAAARQASTHAERRVAAPVAKKQAPAVTAAAATSMAAPRPSIAQIGLAALTWLLDRAGLMLLVVAAIAALRVTLLVRDVFGMFAARRSARRIELPFAPCGSIRRAYAFAASRDLKSPCVLGFSPALIVIPEELLGAPERELLSVVLHEREHVRRYDDVQNVLHRLIDALAFFCPGVRIALRELALYREQICDDAAVNGTGDAVSYAMTLTGMAQWAQGRGVPVPSLIFKRKQLLHRLEVLLDNAVNHSLRMNRRFAAASVVAIVLAAAIVLRVQVPVIAKAIELPPHLPKVAPLRVAVKRVHVPLRVLQVPVPQKRQTVVRPAIKPVKAIAVHKAAIVAPKIARSIARRAAVRTAVAVASVAPVAPYVATVTAAAYAPAVAQVAPRAHSNDILDALDAAGIHNLSVDQLLAIRDHGVSTTLIRAAVAYFGSRISPDDLVTLADHGVSASYLDALRAEHVGGIPPASVVMLMDHGVNASLIREANAYFTSASAADLVYLSDHGVGAQYLESMRVAGVRGVGVGDLVRLMDHGVDARYVIKVRRFNPRASLDDIIRLHDAGF